MSSISRYMVFGIAAFVFISSASTAFPADPSTGVFRFTEVNPSLTNTSAVGSGRYFMQAPGLSNAAAAPQRPDRFKPEPLPGQEPSAAVAPERPAPEGRSVIERFMQGELPDMSQANQNVRQFGYDFFDRPSEPDFSVPVGPDYVVGPDDEIRVSVWGKVEGYTSVTVDRNGKISIPKLGTLPVAGLTFAQLKDYLHGEFSRYYTGFQMDVSMGILRSMNVYVVGNVRQPGSYRVSSLSSLVSVLFHVGGISKTGSLRDIQLKRGANTVVHFDFYDFLLSGDKSRDLRLQPEDVVFVPPVGPLAAVVGSVKNPAIYELREGDTLADLVAMAGGLNDLAGRNRVQVERRMENDIHMIFEYNYAEAGPRKVYAGDVVRVYPVVVEWKTVGIYGAVRRPGTFGLTSGMSVRSIIELAGGTMPYALLSEAELTRISITPQGPVVQHSKINLEGALAGDPAANQILKEDDYIYIKSVPEWDLYKLVTLSGEVKHPGIYTVTKGDTLSALIRRAGGFTDRAYLRGAVFTREDVKRQQQKLLEEMVSRLERELFTKASSEASSATTEEEAKITMAEMAQKKEFIEKLRTLKAKGRMVIILEELDKLAGTKYDIELKGGDTINIPSNPMTVNVMGAVFNQSTFVYDNDNTDYGYYIRMAGGYTDYADDEKTYILKSNGMAIRPSLFSLSSGIDSGDTIVVPEKLERFAWLRTIKDVTQIVYQIAVAAGVVLAAY